MVFCRSGEGVGTDGYRDASCISITGYIPLKTFTTWGRWRKIYVSEIKITNSEKIFFCARMVRVDPCVRENPNIMYDPFVEGVRCGPPPQRPDDNLHRGYVTELSTDVKCP